MILIIEFIAQALWFIAPAYAANAFPPLCRGKNPIDFNKSIGNRRILGDGKTIEGTIGGILFGIFIGLALMYSQVYIPSVVNGVTLGLVKMTVPLVILLSVGAIAGDIIGSFIKRRIGKERGSQVILLDQLDFIVVALFLASFVYSFSIILFVILLIITPPIHMTSNIIGYIAKVKKNPW